MRTKNMYIKFDGSSYGFYNPSFHGDGILTDPAYLAIDDEYYDYMMSHHGEYVPDQTKPLTIENLKPTVYVTISDEDLYFQRRLKAAEIMLLDVALEKANTVFETLTPEKQNEAKYLFPRWVDLIGTFIDKTKVIYVQHDDVVYLIAQSHTAQSNWIPGTAGTEALYSAVVAPGTIGPWVQPTGAHDVYNTFGSGLPKSDPVTHNGQTWKSTVNNNNWEPGVYGWEIYVA